VDGVAEGEVWTKAIRIAALFNEGKRQPPDRSLAGLDRRVLAQLDHRRLLVPFPPCSRNLDQPTATLHPAKTSDRDKGIVSAPTPVAKLGVI